LDYLRVLGRWKLAFILILVLVPAAAVGSSLMQTPTYGATAQVLIDPFGSTPGTYVDPQRVAQTQATLARGPDVVNRVLDAVPQAGLDQEELLDDSSVSATLGSDILTFYVENSDPALAKPLATQYAKAFTEYKQQLDNEAAAAALAQIRQQMAQLNAEGNGEGTPDYDALQRREETLVEATQAQTPSAQVVQPAEEAPKVGPRTVRNGLIAFCLGLVLALIVVFLVDALDTRVKSVDTIRDALGLRLLGRLATPPKRLRKRNALVMLADPTGREAEQIRALRWSLDLANADYGARAIMVTSAMDGEGKSTTVANLAIALARAGRRVVVIDADLARPHLHRLFSLDQRPGLTDVELGDTWLTDALQPIHVAEGPGKADDEGRRIERPGTLEVLPAGSMVEDPDELGFDRAMGRIIERVRSRADVVLVDTSPLLRSNAIALSAHVDAIVVVVRLKGLRTPALEEMGWMLEGVPATKLGFIVTGADKRTGAAYGYGSGKQPKLVTSEQRPDTGPSFSDSPATAERGGKARSRSRSRASRPFGGLSPREAALRSAESRRAKSTQRSTAVERAEVEAAQPTVPAERTEFDSTQDGHQNGPHDGAGPREEAREQQNGYDDDLGSGPGGLTLQR
jgi:capsular exopolysaccharide synthesis family protein